MPPAPSGRWAGHDGAGPGRQRSPLSASGNEGNLVILASRSRGVADLACLIHNEMIGPMLRKTGADGRRAAALRSCKTGLSPPLCQVWRGTG